MNILIVKLHRDPLPLALTPNVLFIWGEMAKNCFNYFCSISRLSLKITPGHLFISQSNQVMRLPISSLISRQASEMGLAPSASGGQHGALLFGALVVVAGFPEMAMLLLASWCACHFALLPAKGGSSLPAP